MEMCIKVGESADVVSSITGGPPSDVFFSFSFFLDLRQVWGIFFIVFSYCYLMTTSTSFARAPVMGPVTGEGGVSTSGDLFCPAFATKHLPTLLAYKKKKNENVTTVTRHVALCISN